MRGETAGTVRQIGKRVNMCRNVENGNRGNTGKMAKMVNEVKRIKNGG